MNYLDPNVLIVIPDRDLPLIEMLFERIGVQTRVRTPGRVPETMPTEQYVLSETQLN